MRWGFIGTASKGSVTLFCIHRCKDPSWLWSKDCGTAILISVTVMPFTGFPELLNCDLKSQLNRVQKSVVRVSSTCCLPDFLISKKLYRIKTFAKLDDHFGWSHKRVQEFNWELRTSQNKIQMDFLTLHFRFQKMHMATSLMLLFFLFCLYQGAQCLIPSARCDRWSFT